jgi:MoaA/NifB/PqqE/SkfB family radical SAM enzyme
VSGQIDNTLNLLDKAARGRRIWIWGAGNQGRGICQALEGRGVGGFIDSSAHLHGSMLMGFPVCGPELVASAGFPADNFIIIAAFFFEKEIAAMCVEAGLEENLDFFSYSLLKPNDYSIDVSGTCNLKCLACPRATHAPNERKLGFMSLAKFRDVLDKIVAESPFVGNVQLYQWGEPVMNPDLPDMIEYARSKGVNCAISSNLNARVDYARIIAARPEWLRISASGWGEDYETTHTKGKWPVFLENLHKVATLRGEHYPEMKVEVYYHLYKHSVGDGLEKFKRLCGELGLELHPVYAYLVSLDDVLGYCEGTPLPPPAQKASELLLLDLEKGIEIARKYAHLPCDALRCININWDGSVSTCMMYYYPKANVITPDYLEMPLAEIQSRRYASDLCVRCTAHGLHQYCSSYARLDTGS